VMARVLAMYGSVWVEGGVHTQLLDELKSINGAGCVDAKTL
jgi:hypothetical protein